MRITKKEIIEQLTKIHSFSIDHYHRCCFTAHLVLSNELVSQSDIILNHLETLIDKLVKETK